MRSLTSRNQLDAAILVRKELLAVADAGTDEEPLKKALLESKWSWIALNGEGGVVMTFHEDGTVNHRGMGGTWKITGPRDVKIIYTDGNSILLHFDETLDSYKRLGSKDQLHGSRLP